MDVGFKSEYFDKLASLERTNFWFKIRNRIIIWAIRKYALNFDKFLEIGCGTGFVTQTIKDVFPGMKITGSEYFEEGLVYARNRVPDASFIQLDARFMPFESEFSMIGAFDVLEHIKEDDMVLHKISDALSSDGVLFLTVPQHTWLWSQADEAACHERRYSARELHKKIENAGFNIVRSTSFVTLLLPVMLLSRLARHKATDSEYDAFNELRINPVLNKILEIFMKVDLFLIRLGIDLPLGGSRLVVARKI